MTVAFDAPRVTAGATVTGQVHIAPASPSRDKLTRLRVEARWVRLLEGGDPNTQERQGGPTAPLPAPDQAALPAALTFELPAPAGTFSHDGDRAALRHVLEVLVHATEAELVATGALHIVPADLPEPGALQDLDGRDGLRDRFGGGSATYEAIVGLDSMTRRAQVGRGAAWVGGALVGAVIVVVSLALGTSLVSDAAHTGQPGLSLISGIVCLLVGLSVPIYGVISLQKWRRRRARLTAVTVPWMLALGEAGRAVVRGQALDAGALRWRLWCEEGALKVIKGKTLRESDREEWTALTIFTREGEVPSPDPDGAGGQHVAIPYAIPVAGPPSLVHPTRTLTWWFEVFDPSDPAIKLRAELLVAPFRVTRPTLDAVPD